MSQDFKSSSLKASDLSGTDQQASVVEWINGEAKKKLSQAFIKLNIDSTKVNGRHLAQMNLPDLELEKKKVKDILRSYDQSFLSLFQRLPARHEKEPMRQIYMYYKKLKQSIAKAMQGASAMN